MKKIITFAFIAVAAVCCKKNVTPDYYQMVPVQDNTALAVWNPDEFDFETGNKELLAKYGALEEMKAKAAAGACTSWRNGDFHGRNLDWYQANYGCLIIQMPKGKNVKHANVALANSNKTVTQEFIKAGGKVSEELRNSIAASVVDGINDAGVAININIVPHQPGDYYIGADGDLCCQAVARYVLDNAGSVEEAIDLLRGRKVRQSIVALAGDQTHYMVSDPNVTAVIEWNNGEMTVTTYRQNENGWFSINGNPAIMTNFFDFAGEKYPVGSDEFFNYHPTAMGVERWLTVKEQLPTAEKTVAANFAIAQSVWYFKGLMTDKKPWYTDNAVAGTGYGKDAQGWYYMIGDKRVDVDNATAAMQGYWADNMESYWATYEKEFGVMDDPHVASNTYWETSHTVIYDIKNKVGYLYPFENAYNKTGEPIELTILQ